MQTRIYNARILTMEDEKEIFQGEIWIDDERISYVGKKTDILNQHFDKEIDAEGNLLMPSFKNAHTHSAMTFGRNYSDTLKCGEWLTTVIFPMEAKMTQEHVYELAKIAFLEYIVNGITACFDMYYEPQSMSRLSEEYGFRTVLCGAINNFRETPETIENAFIHYNQLHKYISYRLGIHAEYTTSLELLEKMAYMVHKYKQPFYTHVSETEQEVKDCIDRYGKTPTQLFDSLGLFDFGGGAFHGVHLTDSDILIYKKRGLSIITNPGSNLKLASGVARISEFMKNGINVGIGTDGPASNNGLDMFKEMYLVSTLQKLINKDASACPAKQVVRMATRGSAIAMGLTDCDVLAVGKYADMIMIDLKKPNMQPINNLENALVYSANPTNILMTMIGGDIKYYKGEIYINDDIENLYARAGEIVNKLA